ncbi:MAG: TA system antitoxin ParD family protein [Acidimicrobiia bacterium]
MAPDRPTRFATDLLESAAAEGARQNRSAKQQLDYWARVGRAVSIHQTAAQRRIEAALADTTVIATLSPEVQLVANAEIDAAIQQHAQTTSYGELLAAEGMPIVALDDDGRLVRYERDGTRTVIE